MFSKGKTTLTLKFYEKSSNLFFFSIEDVKLIFIAIIVFSLFFKLKESLNFFMYLEHEFVRRPLHGTTVPNLIFDKAHKKRLSGNEQSKCNLNKGLIKKFLLIVINFYY